MPESSAAPLAAVGTRPTPEPNPGFWHDLIGERVAANFLGLTDRTLQAMRQRGGGPQFIRVSARCIRYRRIDLTQWAEARMCKSTSDPGAAAA